jgi:hypothetical protein
MASRNESLPRQSDYTLFLYEEELAKIPRGLLYEKAAEGTRKHGLIETEYGKPTNNLIVQMFHDGLKRLFSSKELESAPVIEEQLNGEDFTGKPDFRIVDALIDYKFTLDLKPHVALQLVLYAMLIEQVHGVEMNPLYAFHYPTDHGLFIYKVPDRAVRPLVELANYIIGNHEAIKAGNVERYEALSRWDKLNEDYEVFEPVATVFPPLTITNKAEAEKAARFYCRLKEVIDYEKHLKGELKRYLSENGDSFVKDDDGFGVRLQKGSPTIFYDKAKKAAVMASHKKNLADCVTGSKDNYSLNRFKPSAEKAKQIN